MQKQNYRTDIDALRFFAVLLVILFHCDISWFKGGFIGVDIFFVISGYVMFKSFPKQQKLTPFDFVNFYKKRLFRIYPALLLMLGLTSILAVLWLSPTSFDLYGKHLFFSSLSISNVIFAEGLSYFNPKTPVLLHTWSLGAEMQFYMLFPFFMLLYNIVKYRGNNAGMALLLLTTFAAFFYAYSTVEHKGSFFLLQNRAFEFLIGMCTAALPITKTETNKRSSVVCAVFILSCLTITSMIFTSSAHHPGLYTLAPVLLSAAFIALHVNVPIAQTKLMDKVAYLGRISYGIYLFHFPITLFARDIFHFNTWTLLCINILITLPLAHISYQYFESPIRRYGYNIASPYKAMALIILCTALLSGMGYITAKKEGWPERLKYFNRYAYQVTEIHKQSKSTFTRGYNVQTNRNSKVLFIGDSLLQQYIDPFAESLNLSSTDIDTVTRGGCLLLYGVDFQDNFSDISCNHLRNKLYNNIKEYDLIIISQSWDKYRETLLNSAPTKNLKSYDYIFPFLQKTIDQLRPKAKQIIILGEHPRVQYDFSLEITPTLHPDTYNLFKNSLKVTNNNAPNNRLLFDHLSHQPTISVIHPIDMFCPPQETCTTSNEDWAFFFDNHHLTSTGQELVQKKLSQHLTETFTNEIQ